MLEDVASSDRRPVMRVAVAAPSPRRAHAETLAGRLDAALGGGRQAVGIGLGDAARLEPGSMDALVVMLRPDDDTLGLTEALDHADRIAMPRLILTDARSAAGMGLGAMPMDAPTESVAAMLRGMLARQPEIQRLRGDSRGSDRLVGDLRSDLSRLQDELQLAAQVQREFLPRSLPELPRAAFAAMWRPSNWVSGDIYDVRRLDEHHLGLFVADAVGHGVPAALMTMVICRSLPSKEISGNSYRLIPPSEALAQVNRDLLRRGGRDTRLLVSDFNYFSPNFATGFENRAVKFIQVKENRLSLVKKDKKIIKKTGNK